MGDPAQSGATSSAPANGILSRMLERLFASITSGPSLNCRPHNSRQRIDVSTLAKLGELAPGDALRELLGDGAEVKLVARTPRPPAADEDREVGEKAQASVDGQERRSNQTAMQPAEPELRAARAEQIAEGTRDDHAGGRAAERASEVRDLTSEIPQVPAATRESQSGTNEGADALGDGPGRKQVPTDARDAEEEHRKTDGNGDKPSAAGPARSKARESEPTEAEEQETRARKAWAEQQALLNKLRIVAEEAKNYEDDTGVSVIAVGFPLLSVPAGAIGNGRRGASRRVLAPVAFIPVTLTARTGASPSVDIACRNDNVDRVVPNEALMAWLEQQTGVKEPEFYSDEEGKAPWREVAEIVRHVASCLKIETPAAFNDGALPEKIDLVAAPRAEEEGGKAAILSAAVLGLFPIANQSLLHDTQAMLEGERHAGPIESFLRADAALMVTPEMEPAPEDGPRPKRAKVFEAERLVSAADPCQARAVGLARRTPALVVHGPPGTGKSQTITNIIGDHLARGERVLFVCDKRTALDVVYNRLEHLGLAGLCALVHDPQRDQRELYMAIREQLEGLAEARSHPRAEESIRKTDAELQQVHGELMRHHARLMDIPGSGTASFHELVGRWLAIPESATVPLEATIVSGLEFAALDDGALLIQDVLTQAQEVRYPTNPWTAAAGIGLDAFMSRPMDELRDGLRSLAETAAAADSTRDPEIPRFADEPGLVEQGETRATLADALAAGAAEPESVRGVWAGKDAPAVAAARRSIADSAASLRACEETLDGELLMIVREKPPGAAEVARQLGAIEAYLAIARSWYGAIMFGRRGAAARVLAAYGLPLGAASAERLKGFLTGLRARLAARALAESLQGAPSAAGLSETAAIMHTVESHRRVLDVLGRVHDQPALRTLLPLVTTALKPGTGGRPTPEGLAHGLRASAARAEALARLEEALAAARVFNAAWIAGQRQRGREGGDIAPALAELRAEVPSLEGVLRVKEGIARLSGALRGAVDRLVAASATAEQGSATLRRAALAQEISRRLATDPELRGADARRVETLFSRVRELEGQKQRLVRDAIVHLWVSRQKQRLVVGTGSRLNGAGAEVKRRLTVRGRRAMRLRQVLALGRHAEGGDPIMDLRPVWMASPETVAQIFPREAVFDVVVFDEASQCRLEEALPVLTRARRVVIAGDPKQLPPTRFFEAAVAASEVDEIENDQQLFEAQQGEVEDLLGAALNLDVEACYLDVHYRSRNSDLIGFSNEQFYSSRLQPIPAHPKNNAHEAPITLYRTGGVYENRVNPGEAKEVCRIVKELLSQPKPPSIGIGCFNLAQRDLIAETLNEAASADPAFARKLAAARERRGEASFEGLFVKNLENVQGDERDHIIISTTYGPDPAGRFYKRFGPLAMPGGGRRLNVLVTRARSRVHLVTSIPAEAYTSLPTVPPGQTAGGGWLLFAYLAYAEALERAYEAPNPLIPEAASGESLKKAVTVHGSRWPSPFAESLAASLASGAGVGSEVYWGNDGFCVDVALKNPASPGDVTVGVLCDSSRYALADDPVEWDIFRTAILEGQGWALKRIWSPAFFRDARGQTDAVLAKASEVASPSASPAPRSP